MMPNKSENGKWVAINMDLTHPGNFHIVKKLFGNYKQPYQAKTVKRVYSK